MSSSNHNAEAATSGAACQYAEHPLATPPSNARKNWWTEQRIHEHVTRDFINFRLRPEDRRRLYKPIGFDGLTDDTYMDWIFAKARRFFFILAECGIAWRIFNIVDASWDDEDLPISLEHIKDLGLGDDITNKKSLSHKFYVTQYSFMLRELRRGDHIDFERQEIVPIEFVPRLPAAPSLQQWPRVQLANRTSLLMKRTMDLDRSNPQQSLNTFKTDIAKAKSITHSHIAPVYASYTHDDKACVLSQFVAEHTLKSFVEVKSHLPFLKLPKMDRNRILTTWIHCLTDAVAAIHKSGAAHCAIRPSNIIIDSDHRIAFSDIGTIASFQSDKKADPVEASTYAAPETLPRPALRISHPTPLTRRGSADSGSTSSSGSVITSAVSSTVSSTMGKRKSSYATRLFRSASSTNLTVDSTPVPPVPCSQPQAPPATLKRLSKQSKSTLRPVLPPVLSCLESQSSDVFSLGCIFVDILTFMMKRKASEFTRHRTTKRRQGSRTDERTDSGIGFGSPGSQPPPATSSSKTDASFHANLDKVKVWCEQLERAAFDMPERSFRAVPHILAIARDMLHYDSLQRPSIADVKSRLCDALTKFAGVDLTALQCCGPCPRSRHVKAASSTAAAYTRPLPALPSEANDAPRLKSVYVGPSLSQHQSIMALSRPPISSPKGMPSNSHFSTWSMASSYAALQASEEDAPFVPTLPPHLTRHDSDATLRPSTSSGSSGSSEDSFQFSPPLDSTSSLGSRSVRTSCATTIVGEDCDGESSSDEDDYHRHILNMATSDFGAANLPDVPPVPKLSQWKLAGYRKATDGVNDPAMVAPLNIRKDMSGKGAAAIARKPVRGSMPPSYPPPPLPTGLPSTPRPTRQSQAGAGPMALSSKASYQTLKQSPWKPSVAEMKVRDAVSTF